MVRLQPEGGESLLVVIRSKNYDTQRLQCRKIEEFSSAQLSAHGIPSLRSAGAASFPPVKK
jgi:hypothetical protein